MTVTDLPGRRASLRETRKAHLPVEQVERQVGQLLWSAASLLPNKKIAYRYIQYDGLDILRMLDYVLVSHNNIQEGINVWARLLPLLDVPIEVKASRKGYSLLLEFSGCDTCPQWLFYLINAMHVRWLTIQDYPDWSFDPGVGKIIQPVSVQIKPALPISRQGSGVCLTLSNVLLHASYDYPVPAIQDLVVQFLDWLTPESFGKFGTVDAIKQQMVSLLPLIPSIEQLAEHLCISARTLQRRLKQQDYTYSRLSDEVRHAEALRLLATSASRLGDIAQQLGFSEASSFQRSFQRWQGVSPSQYRRQLRIEPMRLGDELPIQLYYAENRMREQKQILRRTARVWLLISNLGFEKEIKVRCLDMDGLYREYEAHFECFISPQQELWATSNLPVAEPLHFMTSMRVGGRYYVDDNSGAGYRLYHGDEILLGKRDFVHPQSNVNWHENSGWLLTGVIYSRRDLAGKLSIVLHDDGETAYAVQAVSHGGNNVSIWHFAISVVDEHAAYSIKFSAEEGSELLDGPYTATFF